MMILFGEWTPDIIDSVAPTNLETATNVVPKVDGYVAARGATVLSDALGGKCLGGAWFADTSNTAQAFAGTVSALYKMDTPTTWSDVTASTYVTGYDASTSDWQFVAWGNDVIATNGIDPPQRMDMTSGTEFADLSGAPIGATVAVVGDFLVFGRTVESSVDYPARLRWSGFNSSTSWGSSLATQADYQDLPSTNGQIQKIVSGTTGVIFQERAVWTMEYAGPPTVFRFDQVESMRGTSAPNSVVSFGPVIFYYSTDGFQMFSIGSGSKPIGRNRVDQWFIDNCDTSRLTEMRGAVDRESDIVYWAFPSKSAGTNCDRLLVYSIAADRWSVIELETECLFEVRSPGYNLDTLDGILTDIDATPISVDSRVYAEGAITLAVVNSSHKLCSMDGAVLSATLQTGELSDERKRMLRRVTPIIENGQATVRVGYRDRLSEGATWTGSVSENARGVAPFRVNARHHRVKLTLASGFDRAVGAIVDFS